MISKIIFSLAMQLLLLVCGGIVLFIAAELWMHTHNLFTIIIALLGVGIIAMSYELMKDLRKYLIHFRKSKQSTKF
jgi:hypothetical protein